MFVSLVASELPKGFPNVMKSPRDANYGDTMFYGANMTFECDAEGSDVQIRWFFRRVPVYKVSDKATQGEQQKLQYTISNNGRSLKITNLGKVTLAYLECFVANSVGMNIAGSVQLNSIQYISKNYSSTNPSPRKTESLNVFLCMLHHFHRSKHCHECHSRSLSDYIWIFRMDSFLR